MMLMACPGLPSIPPCLSLYVSCCNVKDVGNISYATRNPPAFLGSFTDKLATDHLNGGTNNCKSSLALLLSKIHYLRDIPSDHGGTEQGELVPNQRL